MKGVREYDDIYKMSKFYNMPSPKGIFAYQFT
jgi:hypothetical protein